KFVRRNKGPVLAVSLLIIALVGGIVGTTAGFLSARAARDDEAKHRKKAEDESARAARAEREKTEKLGEALLDRARAGRWSGRVGRRFGSLAALAEAARIVRTLDLSEAERGERLLELRNEAIACLALVDMKPGRSWEVPDVDSNEFAFDPTCEHYVFGD